MVIRPPKDSHSDLKIRETPCYSDCDGHMIKWVSNLILPVLLSAFPAQAQDRWMHVSGVSWHERPGYNGLNWGVGVETLVSPDWSAAVGIYHNSLYRQTWYALGKYHWWQRKDWMININLGVASGYVIRPVSPVILPELCVDWLCLLAVPRVEPNTTGALAAYARIAF